MLNKDIFPPKLISNESIAYKQELESEKQLRKIITTYARIIAHDQRTPIAKISMITDLCQTICNQLLGVNTEAKANNIEESSLIRENNVNYLKEALKEVKNCTLLMNDIINNSLKSIKTAITMHEGQTTNIEFTKCCIMSNLNYDKLHFAFKPDEINDKLLHLDAKHKFHYFGNIISIDQIIMNLLENSLYQIRKFGRGEIFIKTDSDNNVNKLYIKDTAGNITPYIINQILHVPFTTKKTGNRLGLILCKNIMQLFGGNIIVQLVDQQFIEFTLVFPKLCPPSCTTKI